MAIVSEAPLEGDSYEIVGADCRAANREFSAAIPQSAPVNKSGPPHLKAAKTAKMAAGRYHLVSRTAAYNCREWQKKC